MAETGQMANDAVLHSVYYRQKGSSPEVCAERPRGLDLAGRRLIGMQAGDDVKTGYAHVE
jgi:hypothetical protein